MSHQFTEWTSHIRHNSLMGTIIQMPRVGKCLWNKITLFSIPAEYPSHPLSPSTLSNMCVWPLGHPRCKFLLITKVTQCLFPAAPTPSLMCVFSVLPDGNGPLAPLRERHIAYNSTPFDMLLIYLASIALEQCSIFVWRRKYRTKIKCCQCGCDLQRDYRDCSICELILAK